MCRKYPSYICIVLLKYLYYEINAWFPLSGLFSLWRELKEETGVDVDIEPMKPFLRIKYLNSNFPIEGVNTMSMANYYVLKMNLEAKEEERVLTDSEAEGGFHTVNIPLYDSVRVLSESLSDSTRNGAVLDTIEALKEYINITN